MKNYDVTVIIPARNEEKTIAEVIENVNKSQVVKQIIVVDNNSVDNTAKYAKEAGAQVVFCKQQGKGNAMKCGMQYVKSDIVAFIDADIKGYPKNLIDLLTKPLLKEEADFVKSTFERTQGGVVTEIVVKPLLNMLFSDMYMFSEPISGMIALRRNVLDQLEFEEDYGVDIGILIDAIKKGYRVIEVNIGKIENMSHVVKNNDTMKKMSTEIIKAILKRASIG